MKKPLSKLLCLLLGGTMLFSTAACGGGTGDTGSTGGSSAAEKTYTYNPETRPVVFAIGALDQNFNPFFATSATDNEVAGMTQLGMMASDKEGNPVCGPDEATVVLDYKTTMYNGTTVTNDAAKATSTVYEFVIKNGIKFSDGSDLTIKDVLFNLYVYLDPAYMGSATVYSTDIKGLKAYRSQDPTMDDDATADYNQRFESAASERILAMNDYFLADKSDEVLTSQIEADIATLKAKFQEEVASDWTSNEGSLEGYQEEYSFTEDWQSFYLNEGLIAVKKVQQSNGAWVQQKDPVTGKYITDLDTDDNPLTDDMEAARTADKIAAYIAENGGDEENAKKELTKAQAIKTVYETYANTTKDKLWEILNYWATGSTLREQFTMEARSEYFASLDDNKKVQTISGITTYQTSNFTGGENNIQLGDVHDVLKIEINGVDPKAIWNFSFGVTPMAYYSDAATIASTPYGVKTGDADFFERVLKDPEKNGLPMGAGTYMASNAQGDQSKLDKSTFLENNIVYYERNPYFYTVGLDGNNVTKAQIAAAKNDNTKSIHNAIVKYFNYKVVGDDRILQALSAKNIDYGQPNAKPENVSSVKNYSHLGYQTYMTNGYGYVGINPKYVPDVEVRQAIMMAMNTIETVKYYGSLAVPIYRPISTTSWAYPDGVTSLPSDVAYNPSKEAIQARVEASGNWQLNDKGIYVNKTTGKTLKLKFTIAGESKDHPAYGMFDKAAAILNECGFEITVGTELQALKMLATGGLEVWAAAWSSGVDPDMYQIYHKDSTATSVKNWNYEQITDPNYSETYSYESGIVNELSDLIDQGRKTLDQDERIGIYAEALDYIMDLAVELPTYQRNDLVVYNTEVIDINSLNLDPSPTASVVNRIWELDFN